MQTDASHEPFCFELFRRAIVDGCALCWHYLYCQYDPLVRYWVGRWTSPDAAGGSPSTADDLVQDAFAAFWRSFTRDKLGQARGLADVLKYLKTCAVSAALEARRREDRQALSAAWNEQAVDAHARFPSAEASAWQGMAARALWALVEASCNDEREHLVARLILRAGLKPRHIVEQHPDLFPRVGDVYRIKRNLCDRLRRNLDLQAMLENR
jgi:DNA-directed RNA polymerase specialized sigma24 family protein